MSVKTLSEIEETLALHLRSVGIPFEREFKAIEGRKFAWDFRIVDTNILIETQGGTWSSGKMGHNSGSGIKRDYIKNNLAIMAGWRVLYFTSDMITSGEALRTVEAIRPPTPKYTDTKRYYQE